MYTYRNFFIHSSVGGRLGCFRVLAVVNTAAASNGVQSFSTAVFSGCVPSSGIAGPCVCAKSLQSRLTVCSPMDCSPPGSPCLQARILKWVAMPCCRASSRPRGQTCNSCITGRFFTPEPLGKPFHIYKVVAKSNVLKIFFPMFSSKNFKLLAV